MTIDTLSVDDLTERELALYYIFIAKQLLR